MPQTVVTPCYCMCQLYSLLLTAASKELSLQPEVTSSGWICALKKGIEVISRYVVILIGSVNLFS